MVLGGLTVPYNSSPSERVNQCLFLSILGIGFCFPGSSLRKILSDFLLYILSCHKRRDFWGLKGQSCMTEPFSTPASTVVVAYIWVLGWYSNRSYDVWRNPYLTSFFHSRERMTICSVLSTLTTTELKTIFCITAKITISEGDILYWSLSFSVGT